MKSLFLVLLLLLPGSWCLGRDEYRCLWVDVFHPGLRSQQEADQMLAVARSSGFNAILVQVRKACDAFYNSSVEPVNSQVQPGFDPLGYIVRQAHSTSGGKRRLEVHAWLVTYRCRMPGDDMWQASNHVFQRHPDWLGQTASGSNSGSGDQAGRYYLDPGVPAVLDHNLTVVRDILSHYDVDGIHFDYVRYPETSGAGNQWGYNPVSVARFNSLYGRTGKPAPDDPQWCDFRRQQVAFQVRKVYAHVRAWRPHVKVSAATITWDSVDRGFERSDAFANVMQDWEGMANAGWLDLIIPMNYKRESRPGEAADHRSWARFLGETARNSGRFGINGVDGENLNSLPDIVSQINATRNLPGIAGIADYCYAETRRGSKSVPDVEFFNALRQQVYRDDARVPEATWLTRPSQGLIKGVVTRGGRTLDGATVTLSDGRSTRTDGTGFYAFARVNPGPQQVTVSDGTGKTGSATAEVRAGGVAETPIAM